MILHPPPSAETPTGPRVAEGTSLHDPGDPSRSTSTDAARADFRTRHFTLTYEQIVSTAIWNGLGLFFLALFLYLAYARKVEFITRRYPLLVLVQTLTIGSWANALFQSPSAIKWLPQGPDGPLGGHVPRYFLATTACPLWFATCTMRAFSVVADHFANVQMLHDTSRCCAVWTDHLSPAERRFLMALDWVFGTRPTTHATTAVTAATSTDSDPIWPVSATASPSAALLMGGGGSAAPMRTSSASSLAMRRIATRVQLKAVLGATVFGLGVLVPAGMAVAKCFADPAVVPTALQFPSCLSSPIYMTSKYFPLVAMLLTFIAALPLLFILMRGIRDPHHLWFETLSQFVVLDVVLVGYLLVSTIFAKSAPPVIAKSGLVLFALVESAIHSLVIPTVFYLWKAWTESWPRNGLKRLSVGRSSTTVHLEHTAESLKYILKDESLFAKFKESLSRSFCLENGLFWHDLARIEALASSSRCASATTTVLLHAPPPPAGSSSTPSPSLPGFPGASVTTTRATPMDDAPRELNLSSRTRETVAADARTGTLRVASFSGVKDEVFTRCDQAPTALHAGTVSFHDVSRSMATPVANCLWANAFLQSPSAIKWLPQGPDGPLGGSVPRFFLATATCPLTDHLTPTERRFLTALDWMFGPRPIAQAAVSATSTDSDSIWPMSPTTVSPSAALLFLADGRTATIRPPSASALAMRRISTRAQLKAVLGGAAFGLLVLIPAGMAASHCFADPAVVPTALSYPDCLTNPAYPAKKYLPLVAVLLTFIAVLPLLFVLMHGIRDTHYLRLEIMSQFVVLNLLVVGYLLMSTVFAKSAPPIIAESALVLFSLIEAKFHALVIPTMYCLWKGWAETPHLRIGCRTRLAVGKSSLNTVHLALSPESLKYILQDEALFAKFKENLSRSFCLENGLFWHDLARIESLTPSSLTPSTCATTVLLSPSGSSPPGSPPRGSAPTSRPSTAISAAEAATRRALYQLFATFVAPDAPRELNLSSRAREMVAAEAKAGTLRVASFASVKDEVFQAMYTNSLPQFWRN
ncbi:hypothetical protein AMAG_19610 [Allomyces macrogynus ATCC 38327]|uniref:RGS domain-containing protein n=1 Tax=Allomyces macrogynus (strain ATCC 38327) TaxID=578462 RepID=A0A0L0SWA7_ALLM3|nr:hypothetical protein AMAG_19610 [Allomyces macrogynus ATCC 38327]|eukprot:KNE66670.1 hypothetical protein AMAG_19610 [Allomyces macrogynus ATCC 38327]